MDYFMKNLFTSILLRFKLLLFNARPLILFELLFNLASAFVLSPLAFQLFRFAMFATGHTYIDASNLLQFLLNPITIIIILILIFFVSIIALIDISAAVYIFECSREQKKTTTITVIKFAFRNSIRIFKPKNLLLIFVVLVILPLVSIGASSNFIGQYSVPTNLKEYLLSNPLIIAVSLIVLAILVFLSMKMVFAIHYFTLDKVDFITAIKKSWKLLRGNTIRNFISIMIVQVIIAVLTKLLNICGSFFVHTIGNTFGSQSLLGSLSISLASITFLIIYLVLYALFLPYSCLKVSALFYERKKAAKESIYSLNCPSVDITQRKKKAMLTAFIVLYVMSVVLIGFTLYSLQQTASNKNVNLNKSREVIANKKTLLESGENTTNAIKSAANLGAAEIDIDIQISGDNIPFLGKSSIINEQSIVNLNFDKISQIVTRSFTKEGIQNDHLPSLEEAIKVAKESNISLMLDISSIDYKDNKIKIILETIKDAKAYISIASTHYQDISEVKKLEPNIKTIFKAGSAIGDFSGFKDADVIGLDL